MFEVGNFLGGGAAGTVYECENVNNRNHYALKILNPLGYKIVNPSLIRRFNVVIKGKVVTDDIERTNTLTREHVLWVINSTTKQYIACYYSERSNCIKELSLVQCIQVWGSNPAEVGEDETGMSDPTMEVLSGQTRIHIPVISPKYCDFVRRRNRISREIRNMRKISNHTNVIRLEGVLELAQESKCTIFLVMELANGGELFDRLKIDYATREDTAIFFFIQLLEGVKHCHTQGVCHRDLKPENLLLQDNTETGTILKIADFGFSARFAMGDVIANDPASDIDMSRSLGAADDYNSVANDMAQRIYSTSLPDESPMRQVLKSVVGSPFYVAPEVLQARGYDGPKADVWSLGVILYAMLAGNLPFEQELARCKRFRVFCKWVREETAKGIKFWDDNAIEYPSWLFPAKFSVQAKGLIVAMLHPDPDSRITVIEAMQHPLVYTPPMVIDNVENTDASLQHANEVKNQTETMDIDENNINKSNVHWNMNSQNKQNTDSEDMAIENQDETDDNDDDNNNNNNDDDEEEVFQMEEDVKDKLSKAAADKSDRVHTSSSTPFMSRSQSQNSMASITPTGTSNFENYRNDYGYGTSPAAGSVPKIPPILLQATPYIDDLITAGSDDDEPDTPISTTSTNSRPTSASMSRTPRGFSTSSDTSVTRAFSTSSVESVPPSFHDLVKRSTRFITALPASEVLDKIEHILEQYRFQRFQTPIGLIGKTIICWESFRLEVWGLDTSGPPLCAIQLYELPPEAAASLAVNQSSPARRPSYSSSPVAISAGMPQQSLYLVEFIRGQLEIFAFKRFYQWVRQNVSELVKKDYKFQLLDAAQSPMVDSFLQRNFTI